MSVTLQQVLSYLRRDEPPYDEAARLGAAAMPHLRVLAASPDPAVAPRALHLATLIDPCAAGELVASAVRHREVLVRVAAASALPRLELDVAAPLYRQALLDEDAGVRRLAIEGLPYAAVDELLPDLQRLACGDVEAGLRNAAVQTLLRWNQAASPHRVPRPSSPEVLAVFALSEDVLQVVLSADVMVQDRKSLRVRSEMDVAVQLAPEDHGDHRGFRLQAKPLPRLPLLIDRLVIDGICTAEGKPLPSLIGPRFLHGVHTPMELKVPQMAGQFPFRSTLQGVHVSLECCTGCNGGIHDRDLVVVNHHSGGGFSGVWVRTAQVIDGPYPRWQRVRFAGGVFDDSDGSLTLADHGWMVLSKGDEAAHHAPPPLPIRCADLPDRHDESLLAKSLDAVWVELRDVKVLECRAVDPHESKDPSRSRNLPRIELRLSDGSGETLAWLYQPKSRGIEKGQTLAWLRGFVHAEAQGRYVLLGDKDEDLAFER